MDSFQNCCFSCNIIFSFVQLLLTSSSVVDDLVGPVTALVRSTIGWVLVLRMPGIQDAKPPLEAEVAGNLSAGRLVAGDAFTLVSLSGLWTGLASGVEV